MSNLINSLESQFKEINFHFTKKPILIGGMAMEYYELRKSGADIDLIVCDEDYQSLALAYPDNKKDIWADLGVVIEPFEIWRSIKLLDYDFYLRDAIEEKFVHIVSLDRLALMRVFAMDTPKYMDDLRLIKDYYYKSIHNPDYLKLQEKYFDLYNSVGGTIWGGKYVDEYH
jgi:hypothetical protein